MSYQVRSETPQFGVNYDRGYVGFTYYDDSFISKGVAFFERWERTTPVKVSHAFLVSGDSERIDAWLDGGIQRRSLTPYFEDPHVHVFFKKPVFWTHPLGEHLVQVADRYVGTEYDTGLIVGMALTRSLVGKFLEKLTRGWSTKKMLQLFENEQKLICSEFVATVLNQAPIYTGLGVLRQPVNTITPQMLFDDKKLWKAWKGEGVKK